METGTRQGARPSRSVGTILVSLYSLASQSRTQRIESSKAPHSSFGQGSGRDERSLRLKQREEAARCSGFQDNESPIPRSPPLASRGSAAPWRRSYDPRQRGNPERGALCTLTSERLVHAPNAAIQLQDPQGLHPHAVAAAASELGLPVPRLLLPPPAQLPGLRFRGVLVPPFPVAQALGLTG